MRGIVNKIWGEGSDGLANQLHNLIQQNTVLSIGVHPALLAKHLKVVVKEGTPLMDGLNVITLRYLALTQFQGRLNLKVQ